VIKYLAIVWLIASTLFSYDSTIEIVKKIDKKQNISVIDSSSGDFPNKSKFLKLIIGDIKVTTHFIVNDSVLSLASNLSNGLGLKCNFQQNGAGLAGTVTLENLATKRVLYKKTYSISKASRYPFLSHNIVVDLNRYFKLPSIDWMKRYIIFSKYTTAGNSSIVIADYTLTFQKTMISGGLNIFPKWANDEQTAFFYTSYTSGEPTLYKVDVYSGSKQKIASSSGMIVCSDVSNDGSKLLVTMAPNDQPDIYLLDINSGSKKRLTTFEGIDVGGNFVDNGARIVFVSSRLGYPNIFSKPLYGGRVSQMVYHGKNNSSCSTFGKYIVYSSRETNNAFGDNVFNLYLISTQTDSIRKLTQSGKNMYPRFGPNGESIIFIKYIGNRSAIGVIRLNANRSFLFPLNVGKIQSIDW
jgi:TolB protein